MAGYNGTGEYRDWGGYGAIINEAQEIEDEINERDLVSCPVCGSPLDVDANNIGNCPMGHWRGSIVGAANLAGLP